MIKTLTLRAVIAAACAALNPRARYAADTITGRQRWSGSDLRGKAKRFGHSYAVQRSKAGAALTKAGGHVIAIDHGLRVTAVFIGQDDYGSAVWDTTRGPAVQTSAARARLVRS